MFFLKKNFQNCGYLKNKLFLNILNFFKDLYIYMKFKQTLSKILTNKYVLQIVFILCVFNLFGYIIYGNIESVFYFIIIALIVNYFSKNMIIILSIPLLLVNMLSLGQSVNTTYSKKSVEGMENNSDSDVDENTSADTMIEKVKQKNSKTNNTPITPLQDSLNTEESFEVGRKYNNNPIDYQSTIEDAYSDLNKIIGSDGIQKLTNDTQGLMKQQLELTKVMKSMGPLIENMTPLFESAKGLLGGMGEGGINNIAALAKKFST
jgi:hypothetical protein